jgi:uncharacterized protein YoxC
MKTPSKDGRFMNTMPTNKELEQQVSVLEHRVTQLKRTNTALRDDVEILKKNYDVLVTQLSERLEAVHNRFQATPER